MLQPDRSLVAALRAHTRAKPSAALYTFIDDSGQAPGLTRGEFAARVRPQPKWNLRTKVGKAAKAEWLEANPGAIGVPRQDYDDAREVSRIVRQARPRDGLA